MAGIRFKDIDPSDPVQWDAWRKAEDGRQMEANERILDKAHFAIRRLRKTKTGLTKRE